MKQDVFEILLYLFENYMHDEGELHQDKESLQRELQEAGFRDGDVSKALDWLDGLSELEAPADGDAHFARRPLRIYAERELERLDTECRGFLLFLEQMGVLDHATREMVIDRVMALESDEVDLDQIKWVVLMVLFNQPGREAAAAWMEDLVLDETAGLLH